jgi:hypothetical protein
VITVCTLTAILAQGCGRASFSFTAPGTSLPQGEPPVVCAPFDPNESGGVINGLAGNIRYLEGMTATKVDEVLTKGKDAGVRLILNSLNVPTTAFTRGFVDSATNSPLKKEDGTTLIEWFGIDMHSNLLLSGGDAEGYYQFAVLSDDGSILTIDTDAPGGGTVLVNNDNNHATKLGCAASAIRLKKNEARSIRMKYFQGPRTHIALMLLWRKVDVANAALDPSCGLSGPQLYFDSTVVPSAPKPAFNDLVNRGWKVVPSKNFILPPEVTNNPCAR